MDHRLKAVGDNYMSWAHVHSRVTASGAKLRDSVFLSCIKAEAPAPSSEPGHVKMPPALLLPGAVLLLRHPFLSCLGKMGYTSKGPPAAQWISLGTFFEI